MIIDQRKRILPFPSSPWPVLVLAMSLLAGCHTTSGLDVVRIGQKTVGNTDVASETTPALNNDLPVGWTARKNSIGQALYESGVRFMDRGETEKAHLQWQQAAAAGNLSAHFALAQTLHRRLESGDDSALEAMLFHLRLAADKGHSKSQTMLGILYEQGKLVAQNTDLAVRYYHAAALGGVEQAQFNLGRFMMVAGSRYYDPRRAAYWWEQAYAQGNQKVLAPLGWLYFEGLGVSKNVKRAEKLWSSGFLQGEVSAAVGLGELSLRQKPPDYARSRKFFDFALKHGEKAAALPLARQYLRGLGVNRSPEKAVELLNIAAKQNIAEANRLLGGLYARGEGVAQDNQRALGLLRLADEQGDRLALVPLLTLSLETGQRPDGLLSRYVQGLNLQDRETAEQLYQLAQQHNLALERYASNAQRPQIRYLYARKGDVGLQKELAREAAARGDSTTEEKWLELAVSQGDQQAALLLATLYQDRNDPRSIAILENLADLGNTEGRYRLAVAYQLGLAVNVNSARALRIFLEVVRTPASPYRVESAWRALQLLPVAGNSNSTLVTSINKTELLQIASDGGIGLATLQLARQQADPERRNMLLSKAQQQGDVIADIALAEQEYITPERDLTSLIARYNRVYLADDRAAPAEEWEWARSLSALRLAEMSLFVEPQPARTPTRALAVDILHQVANDSADLWSKSRASAHLALIYRTGLGEHGEIGRDSARSAQWQAQWQQLMLAQGAEQRTLHLHRDPAQAISAGETWAMLERGKQLFPTDRNQAAAWYQLAAELGSERADLQLGLRYNRAIETARASESDDLRTRAIIHLSRALDRGQQQALIPLGTLLAQDNDPDSRQRARTLWQQAYKADIADSGTYYAVALDQGIGGQADPKAAAKIWQKLYEDGDVTAGINLARLYISGRGITQDTGKGFAILQQASNQGDARAWLALGKLYANVDNAELFDRDKAAGFLSLASRVGQNPSRSEQNRRSEALYELGKLFDPGNNPQRLNNPERVAQDEKLSYEYYLQSAQMGMTEAQYKAGLGFLHGLGALEQNSLLAYAWLELATRGGDVAASLLRDSIDIDLKEGDREKILEIVNVLSHRIDSVARSE